MKTIDLFNSEKQNLTRQVEDKKTVLPEKYCPNCGQKHRVKSNDNVHLQGFPENVTHIMYFLECPDKEGTKTFVKYVAPMFPKLVFADFFFFRKEDIVQ